MTIKALKVGKRPPTLAAVSDAAMEWWFVQGRIDGHAGPDLYFMCAFFQVRRTEAGGSPAQMLLVHLMRGDGTPVRLISRVSPELPDIYREIASNVIGSRFPPLFRPFVLRRYLSVSNNAARESGIEFADGRATVAPDGFAVEWDGFCLREDGTGYRLFLHGDREDGDVELFLKPMRPWLCETGSILNTEFAPSFYYYSCPRLAVTGKISGASVRGSAWFDRQWGTTLDNWFLAERSGVIQPLGWDWLGLSLDNGVDFLVMRHGLAGHQEAAENCIIRLDDATASKVEGQFFPLSDKPWVSRQSGAAYPLRHRLYVPGQGTDLTVEPVASDQEIPVFGTSPVWEGAVTARGKVEGEDTEGYGRLELFGYGYVDTIVGFAMRSLGLSPGG